MDQSTEEDNHKFVLARLKLAQALLEEADSLPGFSGYDMNASNWWVHPRHEREALVIYLLLTCFDRLGQVGFLTFSNWLKSKKINHKNEKESVLSQMPEGLSPVEASELLESKYQSIYSVRNSFCNGITNLPSNAKEKLLSSVSLSFCAEYGKHGPNVSLPSVPIEDKSAEYDLKIKFLYDRRNRFTHRLEQYHSSSVPALATGTSHGKCSWVASIKKSKLSYWGVNQEVIKLKSGGANVFSIKDWPFTLFEVLYIALGIPFERTTIKLKFQVMVHHPENLHFRWLDDVDHSLLVNFQNLERLCWEDDDINLA